MSALDINKIVKDSAQMLKDNTQKAGDKIKGTNFRAFANVTIEKGKNTADDLKRKTDDAIQHVKEEKEKKVDAKDGYISGESALKLISLIMPADGAISDEELNELSEIGNELCPEFSNNKDEIISSCTMILPNVDTDEYSDELKDTARDIIDAPIKAKEAVIPIKVLLWDMLVIALCDNRYDKVEEDLIKYIAKHLGIDKSIIPEMENSVRALNAVEKEAAFLKATDRPFGIVNPVLDELADRKTVIMQGIHMLITE